MHLSPFDNPEQSLILQPATDGNEEKKLSRFGKVNKTHFGVIDTECLRELSTQLFESKIQGVDMAILLFLMGNFQHNRTRTDWRIVTLADELNRGYAQVCRSINKLKRLGWVYLDESKIICINPSLMRSANQRRQAIAYNKPRRLLASKQKKVVYALSPFIG